MTTKPLTDLTEEQLRFEAAERLWVPCDYHFESVEKGEDVSARESYLLCPCQGTGRVYPLREPCEWCPPAFRGKDWSDEEDRFRHKKPDIACHPCGGRGWTPKQVSALEAVVLAGVQAMTLHKRTKGLWSALVETTAYIIELGDGETPELAVWRALVAALRELEHGS